MYNTFIRCFDKNNVFDLKYTDDVIGNITVSKIVHLGSNPNLCAKTNGSVAEWLNAAVLKTVVRQRTAGSNPAASTILKN